MVVLLDCLVLATSARAVLIEVDGEERWIPRSMLRDRLLEGSKGVLVDVEVKEWFCRQEAIV